jgi:hypothetical protein
MENRIKEQQTMLFADRTSTHLMRSNQIRLWCAPGKAWERRTPGGRRST